MFLLYIYLKQVYFNRGRDMEKDSKQIFLYRQIVNRYLYTYIDAHNTDSDIDIQKDKQIERQ